MPKQRRLDSEAKQEAEKLLALRANKKLVQNHLMSLTSKKVTLKDIHNIAGKAVPAFRNDFQEPPPINRGRDESDSSSSDTSKGTCYTVVVVVIVVVV